MRSRSPLMLMEQLIMVLVFALAAALCLKGFALADQLSRYGADRDRAVLEAQSAAEAVKACGGDLERVAGICGGSWNGVTWERSYDEEWRETPGEPGAYQLLATPLPSGQRLLGMAEISVRRADGTLLFQITTAWQEADTNG